MSKQKYQKQQKSKLARANDKLSSMIGLYSIIDFDQFITEFKAKNSIFSNQNSLSQNEAMI